MEKILRYLSKNPLIVSLIMVFIFVAGILSYGNLKKDFMPTVDSDLMIITVTYPGASAKDVEINAVVPIEEELASISSIDEYTALCIDDGATITVEIDTDVADAQEIKDKIFRNITKSNIEDIPDEVDDIAITDINAEVMSVYEVSVTPKSSNEVSDQEFYRFIDDLEDMLRKIDGVNSIASSGYQDREIHINVDPNKMSQYYISLNDITNSIQARNVRSTGGTLQSVHKEQNIVTIGEFEDLMEVKDVIIRSNFEEKRVRIRDIAQVEDTFEDPNILIRVNKEKAVIVSIKKKENADIITTIDNVKDFFKQNADLFNDKYDLEVVRDMSTTIHSLLNVVIVNAIIGFMLVLLVLCVFLDLKTSFWTAVGIPLSLLVVFIYMLKQDFTFNVMTLGAIITILGMMVDHGIVIAEVIHKNRDQGMSGLDAVINGVKSVISPVIISVLTTIAAFLPLLFISGMMGKFIHTFPLVITVTLMASLAEALFILPVHLSHIKRREKKNRKKEKGWFNPVINRYSWLLKRALKHRYLVVSVFCIVFIAMFVFSGNVIRNFVLLWDDSNDKIQISLEAAKGTTLEYTKELVMPLEDIILEEINEEERIAVQSVIGNHDSGPASEGNHENWAQITINLIPCTEREESATDIIRRLRKRINVDTCPDFEKIVFQESGEGPSPGDAVDIKLIGNDETLAHQLQSEVEAFLSSIPGVKDLDNDQKEGKEELRIVFDYEKLAQLGMNVEDVAQTIRTAYEGNIATSVQTLDQEIDFRVKINDSYQRDRKFLGALLIPNTDGRLIRLDQVATIAVQSGKAMINHYDGNRVVTITANVDEDVVTAGQVAQRVGQKFGDISRRYPGMYLRFGGEVKRTSETMEGVVSAFVVALLLIYFLIIVQFKSFSQPFLIILVIPFGAIGALFAFALHGIPLSLFGLIGIIGLIGVIVNDSIIIVDFINKVFQEDLGKTDAEIISGIVAGAKERLRPVTLTTLTTVVALFPTIYGIGGDAGILVPTVMALAYGLIFATTLTLFLTPSLYMIEKDINGVLGSVSQRGKRWLRRLKEN